MILNQTNLIGMKRDAKKFIALENIHEKKNSIYKWADTKYEIYDNEDCLDLTCVLKNKELQKGIDFILTNFKSLKKI